MKRFIYFLPLFVVAFLWACEKDKLESLEAPIPMEETGEDLMAETYYPPKSNVNQDLKIVSFNTQGATKSEMEDFRDNYMASDVNVLCLQEVSNVNDIKSVFGVGNESSGRFPYMTYATNYTKLLWMWTQGSFMSPPWPYRDRKRTSVVILSKFPIVDRDSKIIQTDPAVDEWRRHGQYVRLKVNDNKSIDLFHYHNTYNFGNNNDQYEKSGMTKFKTWVEGIAGPLSSTSNVFLVGDFNLGNSATVNILGSGLNYKRSWVDYIVSSSTSINTDGTYYTTSTAISNPALSDHNAPWASFNMTTNVSQALGDVVRLYEHSHFRGEVACFELGSYRSISDVHGSWWNDRVSSVRVGSGLQLTAWEHNNYSGKVYYWPQINNSGTLSSRGMNDKISSLKVTVK